jgi:hypothetical protein
VTDTDFAHYSELLAGIYGKRRWLLALDVLAMGAPLVSALAALGAGRCLCIAAARGTGEPPDPALAPDPVVLNVTASDMMGGIRASLAALANLPPDIVERVNAFDPEGSARVLGTIFDDGRAVAGRRKWGARPAAWQALEDKTLVDALWDEVGVERAPARIVAANFEDSFQASRALDRGVGCVWAGDNREGFHGGATYLRWVRDELQAREAATFFAAHCDRARIMPFLEGIPCSIHGLVFEDCTIAFRPCEMLVFRRPGRAELHYGRAATFWDPPAADRERMRQVARGVGDHLRKRVGYRGVFTIDGVLTSEGFRPTELNPRYGAALSCLGVPPELSLLLLHFAVAEGVRADFRPAELERLVLEAADGKRSGGGLAIAQRGVAETERVSLVQQRDGTFRIAGASEQPDALALLGPGPVGAFLRIDLVSERTPVGPSVAPRVAAAIACADAHFGLGIGPLEPARDVR